MRARTVSEAVAALGELPRAQLLAGGTDFMVQVNFGQRRPEEIVALRRVDELRGWSVNGHVELRAGLTYAAMQADLVEVLPALAAAARTVGSPQIRNAGTLGGNLGTASPAGDALPPLLALDAQVVLASRRGERALPLADFVTGPKQTARRPDELIVAVRVPRMRGPQQFCKVGPRNAMAIAVASIAVALDVERHRAGIALGSVGPTPLRAPAAEALLADAVDWAAVRADPDVIRRAAALAAEAARPITDHRSTAAYRRHCVRVLTERALTRCLA